MKQNIVKEKSFQFALNVIDLYKILKENNEYVLSRQLLRSGTSIGANIEEAIAGVSKKDFVYKLSISSKEARESLYWLKLIKHYRIVDETILEKRMNDCEELIKLLTSIVKTSQTNSKLSINN